MKKEVLSFSAFFTFLGIALLFGFRQVFTGNFAVEKFYEYRLVVGLSFYLGLAFFVFGIITFLFFYSRSKDKK